MSGPLLALTSEELMALERAYRAWLEDAVSGDRRRAGYGDDAEPGIEPGIEAGVAEQAALSLQARGMVDGLGHLRVDTLSGALVAQVLDAMTSSVLALVVERLMGGGSSVSGDGTQAEVTGCVRTVYVHTAGGCLHDIHPSGIHTFDLVTDLAALPQAVREVLVPPDAAAGGGPARLVEPGDITALPPLLGQPMVLGELTAVHPNGSSVGHLVALGPGGCFAAVREGHDPNGLREDDDPDGLREGDDPTDQHGQAVDDPSGVHLVFEPVDPDWVATWTQEMIDRIDEPGTMAG